MPYRKGGKGLNVGVQRELARRRQHGHAAAFLLRRRPSVRTQSVASASMVAGPPQQPFTGSVGGSGSPLSCLVELLATGKHLAEGILADNGPRVDGVDDCGAL